MHKKETKDERIIGWMSLAMFAIICIAFLFTASVFHVLGTSLKEDEYLWSIAGMVIALLIFSAGAMFTFAIEKGVRMYIDQKLSKAKDLSDRHIARLDGRIDLLEEGQQKKGDRKDVE